jgi:hypothetical protein
MQTKAAFTLALTLVILSSAAAPAGDGVVLDSREYKLMLDPNAFVTAPSAEAVNLFWDDMLKPVIERRLDRRNGGQARSKKRFKLDEVRTIRFWDTPSCALDAAGFVLRERADADAGDQRELTLKLRTPDLFLAAATDLPGRAAGASSKREEDIAPLLVRTIDSSGADRAVVAQPASMRSLFAVSTKQQIRAADMPRRLSDLFALYPTLATSLAQIDRTLVQTTDLVAGESVRELVFEGAEVDLGDDVDAEFALTFWYTGPNRGAAASTEPPAIAELSFKYSTADGRVPGSVSRRAMQLFMGLQEDLAWARPDRATKTSSALPAPCR